MKDKRAGERGKFQSRVDGMVGEGEGGSAIMHKAAVEKELVDQINEGHYTVASEKNIGNQRLC